MEEQDRRIPRPWRIVAAEAEKETNPQKLLELIRELNQALDEQEHAPPQANKSRTLLVLTDLAEGAWNVPLIFLGGPCLKPANPQADGSAPSNGGPTPSLQFPSSDCSIT